MDADSFQKFPLSHLDFKNENHRERSPVTYDNKKLSSIETLIEQNEETQTKLKISIRKQARFEEENQKIQAEIQSLINTNQSLKDENFILKENESNFKIKFMELEQKIQIQSEKLSILETQNTEYQSDLQRHQKYHDKMRTQVKPYIQQLKEYSQKLEDQLKISENQFIHKETQLHELKQQMLELTKNSKTQIENIEKQHLLTTESYEKEIGDLKQELSYTKSETETLVLKNFKLQKSFERQVDLENQLIELTRSKDLIKNQLEQETLRIQEKNNELNRENRKLQIEHADLKAHVLDDIEKIKSLEKNQYDLEHQLESMRFMWNSKNDENEKLKIALNALEKLNLDLSLKIQELRTAAKSTPNEISSFINSASIGT